MWVPRLLGVSGVPAGRASKARRRGDQEARRKRRACLVRRPPHPFRRVLEVRLIQGAVPANVLATRPLRLRAHLPRPCSRAHSDSSAPQSQGSARRRGSRRSWRPKHSSLETHMGSAHPGGEVATKSAARRAPALRLRARGRRAVAQARAARVAASRARRVLPCALRASAHSMRRARAAHGARGGRHAEPRRLRRSGCACGARARMARTCAGGERVANAVDGARAAHACTGVGDAARTLERRCRSRRLLMCGRTGWRQMASRDPLDRPPPEIQEQTPQMCATQSTPQLAALGR